jgi:uncharacterized protein (TIGR03066 family)
MGFYLMAKARSSRFAYPSVRRIGYHRIRCATSVGVVVMRSIFLGSLVLVAVTALGAAPIPKKLKARSAAEQLLGNWVLTNKDSGYKFTIEYKPDGEMEFRREYRNQSVKYAGTYTIDAPSTEYPQGSITWKIKEGNRERGETSKITKLDETHLTFVDPEGLVEEFEKE